MTPIYLNAADGRKPKKLEHFTPKESAEHLVHRIKNKMAHLWTDSIQDICFDQNISTHIAYIIDIAAKKHPSISVYIDSHEVFWIKDSIEQGQLSLDDMSYPNYAPKSQYVFTAQKVYVFNPEEGVRIENDGSVPIIIHSHVSRLTGQCFPLETIFKKIKEENPQAICIADGAQMLGGQKIYSLVYTDAYISATSKFVEAEPHLGLCLLNQSFKNTYLNENIRYPSRDLSQYIKELYSTNEALHFFSNADYESYIQSLRAYVYKELPEYVHSIHDQVPHIVTLHVQDEKTTRELVNRLEKEYAISVSHNMDYSLIEPALPLIRISLSIRTNRKDIDALVRAIRKMS